VHVLFHNIFRVKILQIPAGHKFAVVAVETAPSPPEILFPLQFDGGLWALSRAPFHFDEVWQRWLGLRADDLKRSNLFLIANAPSENPKLLDDENQKLERSARFVFLALAIEGLYLERAGLILQGGMLADSIGPEIRSVHDTSRVYRLEGSANLKLSAPVLVRAAHIATNMQRLLQTRPVPRLWKGVMSLITALESRAGADRIHGFVRALDAIAKPPQGEGERKFVHRCSMFAGRSDTSRNLLRELYQLRSAAEHLNDFQSVLDGYPFHERERIALQRTEQAEILARQVYVRILSSDELTGLFSDDPWLDRFWATWDQTNAF
jgi:hypothetical protein